MGAIAGAIGYLGGEIEGTVRRMLDVLGHRGGDGVGVLTLSGPSQRQGAVLGAAYSQIVGPNHQSQQPMVEGRTGTALVFNGTIYNSEELRDELRAGGEEFRSASDTEVVLKAHSVWRTPSLARLEGMFALAAWDPDRQKVLLARDRFGFKPLFWGTLQATTGERTVLFASEMRALLRTGLFPRLIDPVALESYVWNGCVMSPHSMVQGIECLSPGTSLEVSADGEIEGRRRYWVLGDHAGGSAGPQEVGDALRRAVERQLRCDVPLGFFLSGGLDSSSIVALAAEMVEEPLRTFGVGFRDSEFDESPHAWAVAEALGTDHTQIHVTQEDFEEALDSALDSLDQPTFDGLNTYLVSKAVRAAGIKVALGGTGGDDLFGGNRTFVEVPYAARWSRRLSTFPEQFLAPVARFIARLKSGRDTVPAQTRWGKLPAVLAAKGSLLDTYQLTYALFTPEFIRRLITVPQSPALRSGVPRVYADEIELCVGRNPELYGISQMEIALFLGEKLLPDIDSASGAVGLEVRVPFLDDGLIEVWRHATLKTAYEPIGRKAVLLETALSRLDPTLFQRPKAGFVIPIGKWCRDRLASRLEDAFGDSDHCRAVGLDPATLQVLWTAFKQGDRGLYWSRIWAVFVYLQLCKREGLRLAESSSS